MSTQTTDPGLDATGTPPGLAIIDADAHNNPTVADLAAHLPQRWRDYLDMIGLRTFGASVAALRPMSSRLDAIPPNGIAGNDVDFFRRQLLDEWSLELALLNPTPPWGVVVGSNQPEPLNDGLLCATNDWVHEQWLEADRRFIASLSVTVESPALAIAEMDRWAHEPRFVQLLLGVRMRRPLGHPQYRPVLERAAAAGLPVALHPGPGENPGHPMTGAGWPSYYLEAMTNASAGAFPHLLSLIFEGVFDELPDLQIVMTETGWSWLPSLVARADRLHDKLRREVPGLQRRPSDYVRSNVWFTSQPMEEPGKARFFPELLEEAGLEKRLMFATDYPHWDFDSPASALPRTLPQAVRADILAGNARRLYGLDDPRGAR